MKLKTLLVIMCLAVSMIPIVIIGGMEGFRSSVSLIGLITIVTFTASLIMAYLITRPIDILTKKINNISKGELDVKLEKSEIFEINELTNSLNRVMASLKLAVHKVGVKKGEIFENTVQATNSTPNWSWDKNEAWSEQKLDSVFILDENGKILDCNDNMHKKLGYSKDEMLSFDMFDFDTLESKDDLQDKIKKAKKNGSTCFKTIHKKKNGSVILVNENLQYLEDKNVFKCIAREEHSHKR